MEKVYQYLIQTIGLKKEDVIVVGVSGGPDSMALLYILYMIRRQIPFSIVVAHVNHNIRKESEKEAIFLEKGCKEHEIVVEKVKVEQ